MLVLAATSMVIVVASVLTYSWLYENRGKHHAAPGRGGAAVVAESLARVHSGQSHPVSHRKV